MKTHYCWVNFCCYPDQCHNAGSGLRCNKISAENRMFCKYCIEDGLTNWQLEYEIEFFKGKIWKKESGRVVY